MVRKYRTPNGTILWLEPYQMTSLKTKNLANHKISKVLVYNGFPFGDLAGGRTLFAQPNQSRVLAKIYLSCRRLIKLFMINIS